MPPRQSIVLVDTNAIAAAHEYGCWNALRRHYQLHSVRECLDEATRPNKRGARLVARSVPELSSELIVGAPDKLAFAGLVLAIGNRIDVDAGERALLAYARTLPPRVWWLCGPDKGTLGTLHLLGLLDRMVALESLAKNSGHPLHTLPANYTDRWLSDQRTRLLLDGV
jgi:hypothetical protein